MKVRTATLNDLPKILTIYQDAREYMAANGNPNQWKDHYPSEEILREDLSLHRLFVCEDHGETVGVFCYFFGDDSTYAKIYEGAWLNDRSYGVMHRVAVASHQRGVASFCIQDCFSKCKNLKIDTHRDNIPMQKSLAKNGFRYCGIIYLDSGDERLAYQKVE